MSDEAVIMDQKINRSLPMVLRFILSLLCIFVTKLVLQPFQSYLKIQVIELIFLLPVMLCTVLWGLTPGILAGIAAFLAFNFFYIQPYNTFLVHQSQDLITLIIFLFVSVILSQFIGKAREGMQLARSREWEATKMYELISSLSGLKGADNIARDLAHHTLQTFQFRHVKIIIFRQEEDNLIISAPNTNTNPEVTTYNKSWPLETARGLEGEIKVCYDREPLTTQETRLLIAFTSQAALALERVRLAKGENMVRILEESDRLKTSLLNSVSHEFRTPLAVIKASVSSLRSGLVNWNNNARQDLLATIEEETDQLNLLVGNLLDMSKIESNAMHPNIHWNAIDEIVIGVATKMRKQLSEHYLEMNFEEGFPLIPTDYVMISQVFTNLISNSIKYSPTSSKIMITIKKDNEFAHIEVANEGPPVPEEHLERIFDKFYRVTEAERITGTGLGLSICKGIVEAHGGKIWAKNEDGQFVFHFSLPLTLNGALPKIPSKEDLDE